MTTGPYVSDSIEIAAPAPTIFNLLADPRRHADFDGSGTVQGTVVGPERLSRGAEFGMTMRLGIRYQVTNKVITFVENREIAWRHIGRHVWRYRLEPLDDEHTRVTETWDCTPMLAPVRWVVAHIGFPQRTETAVHATLHRLKDLAEA